MQELTKKQQRKLLRLARIESMGSIGIAQEISDLENEIDAITSIAKGEKGDRGEKGDKGDKGNPGSKGDKGDRGERGKDGREGRDGRDGIDGLDGNDGRDGSPDTGKEIVDKINELETDDDDLKIDASHIKNLPKSEVVNNYLGGSKNNVQTNGVTLNGVDTINFGSGLTVVQVGNIITVTASGGGGSGVTVETPPEVVNAVNATFTVTHEPKWVVSDGVTYFAGAGYTYAALSITLDIPPSQYIRSIY